MMSLNYEAPCLSLPLLLAVVVVLVLATTSTRGREQHPLKRPNCHANSLGPWVLNFLQCKLDYCAVTDASSSYVGGMMLRELITMIIAVK